MAKGERFVFDTNEIVSALLIKASVARRCLDRARETGRLLLSVDVIKELQDVLGRPDFDRYIAEEDRIQFLTLLTREAELVDIKNRIAECRDPKDDKFLELAVNGKADVIVSGDKDLLVLHPFRNVPILAPRDFLEAD